MSTSIQPIAIFNEGKRQQQYLEMMQLYEGAIKEIRTKVEVLDAEFRVRYARNPIHHIDARLKSPKSIAEKLRRKGLPQTIEAAEAHLFDIAGIRIVCNYLEDIYRIAELLSRQRDVEPVELCDYIKNPKESGYRSLHLVVRIPVFLSSHTELVPVEIQIRTIAMDFWASLEHQLRYKSDQETKRELGRRLQRCADMAAALDVEMQSIYREINGDTEFAKNTCEEADFGA